jgi:CRP-like cAMP-binding protein
MTHHGPTPQNGLLALLPSEDYRRIAGQLRRVELRAGQKLQGAGDTLQDVYFPVESLCSISITMSEGATADAATVGPDGLVGVEAVFGLTRATGDILVRVTGKGCSYALGIEAFRAELDRGGALFSTVTRYSQAFVGSLVQSVACNGLHTVEARGCRWLLDAQDRLGGEELPLTHELLATILGVRRPTISLLWADLAGLGIIAPRRGVVRIVDREALEHRSCVCYRIVRALFNEARTPHLSSQPKEVLGGEPWRESLCASSIPSPSAMHRA